LDRAQYFKAGIYQPFGQVK